MKFAREIAEHLGIFGKEVLASDAKTNLKGDANLRILLEKYGTKGYDYAADSYPDLKIWAHANQAAGAGLQKRCMDEIGNVVSQGRAIRALVERTSWSSLLRNGWLMTTISLNGLKDSETPHRSSLSGHITVADKACEVWYTLQGTPC